MVLCEKTETHLELFLVVLALDPPTVRFGARECRHQQQCQHRERSNHHEQFGEGKGLVRLRRDRRRPI